MTYEPVIGLEVHAQLRTESKIFCGCSTSFGAEPNTHTCPVCLGMPGVLPVLNVKVVEFALRLALATQCQVASFSKFARKNYFYPDLPKGYQISQYEQPLAVKGHLAIPLGDANHQTHRHHPYPLGGGRGQARARRAKTLQLRGFQSDRGFRSWRSCPSLIWRNARRGGGLSEGASGHPGVSGGLRREHGGGKFSVRCQCLGPSSGQETLGTRTELKNMNSFRNVQRAIEYETDRQVRVLEEGGKVVQETRLWDEPRQITHSMRGKEEAHDYRYFPDPDLVPIEVDRSGSSGSHGICPNSQRQTSTLVSQYSVRPYDSEILTGSRALADYFEACAALFPDAQKVSNWVTGDLLRSLNQDQSAREQCPISPEKLVSMLRLLEEGRISRRIAQGVFEEIVSYGRGAR